MDQYDYPIFVINRLPHGPILVLEYVSISFFISTVIEDDAKLKFLTWIFVNNLNYYVTTLDIVNFDVPISLSFCSRNNHFDFLIMYNKYFTTFGVEPYSAIGI